MVGSRTYIKSAALKAGEDVIKVAIV